MHSGHKSGAQSQQRVVRVYISSTFRDMRDERSELVRSAYSELRRRCKERGIEFVDVDLRRGMPDDKKAEEHILPLCFAEIERSSPYFIGLLGERYGRVPDEIDRELAATLPWLNEHHEQSVTELEIIHGVLNNPEAEKRAFFYFRDPRKSLEIEDGLRKEKDYEPEPQAFLERLDRLKNEILKHESDYPVPVRRDFIDAKALARLVVDDLWNDIDKTYPIGDVPTPLERERMAHEAFAEERSSIYVGRDEYFKTLDKHVESDSPPLVLLGESGCGKSALLANWARGYRERHPEDFILLHFIGCTADSSDYTHILRRIIDETRQLHEAEGAAGDMTAAATGGAQRQGFPDDIPTDPKKLIEILPAWLAMAADRRRCILVLDALDQLEDRDNASELGWLPEHFPPNIRVILSSPPGKYLEAVKRRSWQTYSIELLAADEKKRLIGEYLGHFNRELSAAQADRISNAKQTSNPLYLKALLDELRVFGSYFLIDQRLDHYLTAKEADELYEKILERYEEDYERDRPGLVKDAMSFIWASRRGLSEIELLDVLGSSSRPLPPAYWSPLHLAAEGSLVSRTGQLNFVHEHLSNAVERKYLGNVNLKRAEHLRLADYFESRDADDRKVDELPWQLKEAQEWNLLKECVTNREAFLRFVTHNREHELVNYWLSIGDKFDMVEAYDSMIVKFEATSPAESELAALSDRVSQFICLSAKEAGSGRLQGKLPATLGRVPREGRPHIIIPINNIAESLRARGDLAGARKLQEKALDVRRRVLGEEHPSTLSSLDNLAETLRAQGDLAGARKLHEKALEVRRRVLGEEHPDTLTSRIHLSETRRSQGDLAEARKLQEKVLDISRRVHGEEHPATLASMNYRANTLRDHGDLAGARKLHEKTLDIRRRVHGEEHPDTLTSKNDLAETLRAQGDLAGARTLHEHTLDVRRRVLGEEHPDTLTSIDNLADILRAQGDLAEARKLHEEVLEARRRVLGEEHPDTLTSRNHLSETLHAQGDLAEARKLQEKVLDMRKRVLGEAHPDILTSMSNLAGTLSAQGDLAEARKLQEKVLDMRRREPGEEHPDTLTSMSNLAGTLYAQGDLAGARKLQEKALGMRRRLLGEEHPDTLTSMNNLALTLFAQGDLAGAEPLYRQVLTIQERRFGEEQLETIQALFNLAQLTRDKKDHSESSKHYKRVVAAGEQLLDKRDVPMPGLLFIMAVSHNEIAFHTNVPTKSWEEAEYHYRKSIDLFDKVSNQIETANVKLNLQTMYYLSGGKVDKQQVSELKLVLESAGDKRAEKGRKLLKELP